MLPRLLVLIAIVAAVTAHGAAQSASPQLDVLRDAAAKGSAPAQYALGAAAEKAGDLAGALTWYRKAATAGYAGAQYSLALMLDAGLGTTPDPIEAERLLQRAAAADFQPALQRLARREAARADASRSPSVAPVAAVASTGLPTRSLLLTTGGWALAVGLLTLAAMAFVRLRSRRALPERERRHRVRGMEQSRMRSRRRR